MRQSITLGQERGSFKIHLFIQCFSVFDFCFLFVFFFGACFVPATIVITEETRNQRHNESTSKVRKEHLQKGFFKQLNVKETLDWKRIQ